ncbi:Citrate transporter [Roseivivax jejudonensis]|uniref:Citrate transporter n=1 Tax=Roseivivax jejudonensis TaxID=1529041 RepID=A0A1X7A6U7_9RHOB|nr:GntP family permease [Roseivivax jejudonensis]SLN71661.1 Citrate transporter [Roseivivax jejudonensis]
MGLFGILLALGLLIFLAYKGASVLVVAPVMALLAAAFSLTPGLATYTQVFMPAAGGFIVTYFPLFLLGAIFGRLMDASGSAKAISNGIVAKLGASQAIPAVVLACAVLTYGGVSLFVVAFAIFPVAAALFRQADIPKRLIPATIALGAFTFTMTALPGTPAIQNAIPMPYFGTTPFAAPGLGLIAAAIMGGAGFLWLERRKRAAAARGEGYGEAYDSVVTIDGDLRDFAMDEGFDLNEINPAATSPAPPFWLAALPIVVVIALNYALSVHIFPAVDTSYLSEDQFGATDISELRGLWSVIAALTVAIVLILATSLNRLASPRRDVSDGANAAVLPILNTASLVGFGAVVAALPAFAAVSNSIDAIGGGPLVSLAISTNVLAGLTGSASGGMSIALEALGSQYLEQARMAGIAPDLLHRVTTIATGGLDSLPHNGAVITLLGICGLSHKDSYADIAVVAVLAPILSLIAVILLGSVFGSF